MAQVNSRYSDVNQIAVNFATKIEHMKSLKILAVSIGDGYTNPMNCIIKSLTKRGYSVIVLVPRFMLEKCQQLYSGQKNIKIEAPANDLVSGEQFRQQKDDIWVDQAVTHVKTLTTCDVVLSDYTSVAGSMIADALHLPLVVNTPACLEMYETYSNTRFAFNSRTCACCGILCILEPILLSIRQLFVSWSQSGQLAKHVKKLPERLVLINSFWGLEPPALLPPNVRLTGPLSKSDQGSSQKLLKS